MGKTVVVFSRLANSQKYTGYKPASQTKDGQVNTVDTYVLIRGGANLIDKHLQTPLGVPTRITEEEAAFLETHNIFNVHRDNGFVTIENSATERDVDAVVADMGDEADGSAPITPTDFQENDGVIGKGFNGQPTAETDGGGKSGSNKSKK